LYPNDIDCKEIDAVVISAQRAGKNLFSRIRTEIRVGKIDGDNFNFARVGFIVLVYQNTMGFGHPVRKIEFRNVFRRAFKQKGKDRKIYQCYRA
jgi:hypothetical protein